MNLQENEMDLAKYAEFLLRKRIVPESNAKCGVADQRSCVKWNSLAWSLGAKPGR